MNKIYKIIWSKVKHQYVVVSELAKAHSKGGVRSEKRGTSIAQRMFVTSILAAVLSGGIGMPFLTNYVEAAITDLNGGNANGSIVTDGNTTNVYAQRIEGTTGINRFKEFDVAANNVANLHFNKLGETDLANNSADNLVNLVNSRINVAGTVNAIKNNQIGGNLFFLSSDGMAVTGTGAINAGSLTVLTPTRTAMYNYMYGGIENNNYGFANIDEINKMIAKPATVPLNQSGTISVAGQIHTTNGIALYAGEKVDIQKEKNSGTPAPVLKTGVVNFSTVNTGDLENVSLTATQNGSGDIVLVANNMGGSDHNVFTNNTVNATVTVGEGAQVTASGDVKVNATATTSGQYTPFTDIGVGMQSGLDNISDGLGTYLQNKGISIPIGSITLPEFVMTTNAVINLDGAITGKTIDVDAETLNTVANGVTNTEIYVVNNALNFLNAAGINIKGSFAEQNSKAEVNVNEHAVLTATDADKVDEKGAITGSALDIKAHSRTETTMGITTAKKKYADNWLNAGFLPSAGAVIMKGDSEANINVASNAVLKANHDNGSVNLAADSYRKVISKTANKTSTKSGTESLGVLSISYLDMDNKATVTVAKDAKITAGKDVTVDAETTNYLDLDVTVEASEDAAFSTAVNYFDYDAAATTNVNGVITAGNDVKLGATNTFEYNMINTENAMGDTIQELVNERQKKAE